MPVYDQFRLDDRVAIVTGGAGLLGRAFCRTLAEAGARVVVADVDRDGSDRLAESIQADGYEAMAVPTDVTAPEAVRQMVETTLHACGGLHILVNSAALDPKFDPGEREAHTHAFEDFPLETWNRSLEVDVTGMFLCAQAAGRAMLEAGGGVIINLCSIYGLVAPDQRLYERPGEPPQYKPVSYAVTKAAVLGLTRYLATYYAGNNIRVNALSPGGVYDQHDEAFSEAYAARTVLGRMADVDDLQGGLLFLASDASSYVTGTNLVIDGGWSVW